MLTKRVCYFVFIMSIFFNSYADSHENKKLESFFFNVDKVRFVLHGTDDDKMLANNIKSFAKDIVPKINEYFGYSPKDLINIVLEKKKMSANGFAHTFPYNKISIRLAQPIGRGYLSHSVNYYKKLFIHEYVHILHLERTEGFSEYGSKVFGSIARLVPQIVPRWFTEGVAMWAEDHFTNEGRLKNDYLNIEVANFLKDGICSNISCLDQPGVYPFGSLAYWGGGAFLKYVENRKEGSIACIVKDNADLPTLSRSFRNCTGMSHNDLFIEFTESLKPYGDDQINFQKGLAYKDGKAYYIISSGRKSTLRIREMKNNSTRDLVVPYYVEKLEEVEGEILITVRSSLSDNYTRKILKLNEAQGFEELTDGIVAYKGMKSTQNIEISFDDKWIIKDKKNDKDIIVFNDYETLFSLAFVESEFYFVSSNGVNYSFYQVKNDGTFKKTNISKPYSLVGVCEQTAIYRHGNDYLLSSKGSLEKAKIKLNFDPSFIGGSDSETIALSDTLNSYPNPCLSYFYKKKPLISFNEPLKTKEISFIERKEYSGGFELMPKYWFILSTVTEDDLQYYSIITSFEDPMKKNQFNLSLDYYSDNSDVGGNFSYIRSLGQFELGASYQKDFQKSSVESNSFEENFRLSLNYETKIKDFSWNHSLYSSYTSSKNFISESTIKRVGVGTSFYRYPKYHYELFNNYHLYASVSRNLPEKGEDFNRYTFIGDLKFDLYKDYMITLRQTYEELDKDTFSNGIIYGGGTVKSIHQAYGIPYSDVLGNKIIASKIGADFKLLNIGTGWGLIPFYMRSFNALFGYDMMESDFIILKNKFNRDAKLKSFYYGAKINSTVFYRVPLSIEAVMSHTEVANMTEDDFQLIFRSMYTY